MSSVSLYPPAPATVPPEVTRLPAAYRVRVAAMLLSLFAFLVLYLAIVAAAGLLAYVLLILPMPDVRGRGIFVVLVFKFGGALAAFLLALFLFKGLFKGQKVPRDQYRELHEADHPELFAFLRRLCQDTGAPRPRKVYASPEVNAAVIYNTSLLNLVLPPRKDLLIGLGLVNVVNLAELKAVLAHEFGHFAQKSVGLGSYLYIANRVLHDVVYGRDGLDHLVDQWCAQDIRISFPAWGLKGTLWLVRQMLGGVFRGLNLVHLSLSRQMEFNADNVAVSVTGSEAIVHALSRLDFASDCLADAARSLNAAADHGVMTDDLFFHQAQAATRLRALRKDEQLGRPPELVPEGQPRVRVFQPEDGEQADRWRSHPTNAMREQNAIRFYVPGARDDRSPWLLFGDVAALKQSVTETFYRHSLDRLEAYAPRPAAEVQAFLDAEHAETTYDPRYHGFYDGRFLAPGEVKDLPADPWPPEKVTSWLAGWPGDMLREQVAALQQRQEEHAFLQGLSSGRYQLKGKTFPFRDEPRTARDVEPLLKLVETELDAALAGAGVLDRDVLLAHWSPARHLDGPTGPGARTADLLEHYRFHLALQVLLRGLLGEQGRLQGIFHYLSGKRQLDQAAYTEITGMLEDIRSTLLRNLDEARQWHVPALTNVPAGTPLYDLIVDRGETALPPVPTDGLTGNWLTRLATRLDGVLERVNRLHFKSLGRLLALQEALATEWQTAGQPTSTD